MPTPADILQRLLVKAERQGTKRLVKDTEIHARIDFVCRCLGNRAGVRLLMACLLAKLDRPAVDPRKPYTEIGSDDCFSGRTYDERYLTPFIVGQHLPCNHTTAFLTPTLRNQNTPLTNDVALVGRPPQLCRDALQLLDDVTSGRISAEKVLQEAINILLQVRNEKRGRMETLVAGLQRNEESLPLSSEEIVVLLQQHLACKHSSRLPVLMVAAAYEVAADRLMEKALALRGHLAADEQTGALGDVEIRLSSDDQVVTSYEMKAKRVTRDDIDRAVQKIVSSQPQVDNYIFITTDFIDPEVQIYAASLYEKLNGTEIAILDCIGFVRHFLHLFHRLRIAYLDAYQRLLLAEPDSAVKQPLKEAFLSLRQAAESDE